MFFVAAMATAVLAASCSKDFEQRQIQSGSEPTVQLTLLQEPLELSTRSFFDQGISEAWERMVTKATLFVLDDTGNLALSRTLSASECGGHLTFAMPCASAGKTFDFYVVANCTVGPFSRKAELEAMMDGTSPAEYNGAFGEMNTGCLRAEGFVMSGRATGTMPTDGTTRQLNINLLRNVAKIAVQTTLNAGFSAQHNGGTVEITGATLSGAAAQSFLLSQTPPAAGQMTYMQTQASNKVLDSSLKPTFQNLFYIYGNPALSEAQYVTVTLDGIFDGDGNPATMDDRSEVQYTVTLNQNGGAIAKNGYHKLNVNIKGLPGVGVNDNFSIQGWSVPVEQFENAGF